MLRVQQAGLNLSRDVFVVYSPERECPGNQSFDTRAILKAVGGALHGLVLKLVRCSTVR